MRHRHVMGAAVGAALLGCSDPGVTPPIDGSPDGDAATGSGGLRIDWESRPMVIPGSAGSNATVVRALFRTRDLRVIGDTTPLALPRITLEWRAGVVPGPQVIADAMPGLYSRVLFALDAGTETDAYEVIGAVEVDHVVYPFTIRDRTGAAIALDFALTLPPGGNVSIPIRVEADKLATAVDFTKVVPTGGQLLIEDGHPELDKVRNQLPRAFGVHSPL